MHRAPTNLAVTYLYVNEGHFEREITKCSARMKLSRKVTVITSF
jgi:hypothetical protein